MDSNIVGLLTKDKLEQLPLSKQRKVIIDDIGVNTCYNEEGIFVNSLSALYVDFFSICWTEWIVYSHQQNSRESRV